jgi:hypothetical protein
MEAVRTSEASVDNHFTRQYNPEDSSEHLPAIVSSVLCFYAFGPFCVAQINMLLVLSHVLFYLSGVSFDDQLVCLF